VHTVPVYFTYKAAVCQNTASSLGFSTPTSNAPTAACVTGTNSQYAVAEFDADTDESVQDHFGLSASWTGNIDLTIKWRIAATTGDVVWAVQTACVADGESLDPAWNTASTVTDTAQGTTLRMNSATMSAVTVTGCAAGEELFFRLYRDANNGSDTVAGDAFMVSAQWTVRNTT